MVMLASFSALFETLLHANGDFSISIDLIDLDLSLNNVLWRCSKQILVFRCEAIHGAFVDMRTQVQFRSFNIAMLQFSSLQREKFPNELHLSPYANGLNWSLCFSLFSFLENGET